jgi:hypothetical protein
MEWDRTVAGRVAAFRCMEIKKPLHSAEWRGKYF